MRSRNLLVVLAAIFALTLAAAASANMAKSWSEGEGRGPLVPMSDTEVGVESEDLVFDLASSRATADVTATYRMVHAGAAPTELEVAFVVVEADGFAARTAAPEATITIDGAPVTHHVLTSADALAPILDAWLESHPEVEAELERLAAITPRNEDWLRLATAVPGCYGECYGLTAWYRLKKHPSSYDTDAMRRDAVLDAAKIAVPQEVKKLYAGWSVPSLERPLSWLRFRIPFSPGATRTVVVRYLHVAGWDRRRGVNETFTYDYALSPAKRWARFGAFHLAVHVPPKTLLGSTFPLTRSQGEGDTYRADLPTLPSGELSFDVMSTAGVPFDVNYPWVYWCVLLGAMLLATTAGAYKLGRLLARRTSDRSRAWRIVGGVLAGGLGGVILNTGLAALASAIAPRYAFGYGYEAAFGAIGAVALFTVTAIVITISCAMTTPPRALG